jgi:hypothetical protein
MEDSPGKLKFSLKAISKYLPEKPKGEIALNIVLEMNLLIEYKFFCLKQLLMT